jgi:hypothetical protein
MKPILITLLLIGLIIISGCSGSKNATDSASPTSPSKTNPPLVSPNPVSATHSPTAQHNITDGYWCRNSRARIQEVETEGRQCIQFFPDGTWATGFSPGIPMHKTDDHKCQEQAGQKIRDCDLKWSINSKGQFNTGGEAFTLSGDTIRSDSDYIAIFDWSPSGIP